MYWGTLGMLQPNSMQETCCNAARLRHPFLVVFNFIHLLWLIEGKEKKWPTTPQHI